jgi:hypothetical protein
MSKLSLRVSILDEIHIPYIKKSYKTNNYEISDVEEKIDYTYLHLPKTIMDKLKNAANIESYMKNWCW